MRKRIISLILSVILTLSCGAPAFALDAEPEKTDAAAGIEELSGEAPVAEEPEKEVPNKDNPAEGTPAEDDPVPEGDILVEAPPVMLGKPVIPDPEEFPKIDVTVDTSVVKAGTSVGLTVFYDGITKQAKEAGNRLDIPDKNQRIYYNGVLLDEFQYFSYYEIPTGSILVLKLAYDVEVSANDSDAGSASANVSTAEPGETVTLTAAAKEGYHFARWECSDADVDGGSFTMPAKNVSVKAVFESDAPKRDPSSADFTLSAPQDRYYDGNPAAAKITPAAGVTGMGNVTVKYRSEEDYSVSAVPPTDPGTYQVIIDVAEGAAYNAAESITAPGWTFEILSNPITAVEIPYTAPAVGEKCAADCSGMTADPRSSCCVLSAAWHDAASKQELTPQSTFESGHRYYLEVCLEPEKGYVFPLESDGSFSGTVTLNGTAAQACEGSDGALRVKSAAADPVPARTVSFDLQGHGAEVSPITGVVNGTTITAPAEPEADGFLFVGWYKETGCVNKWDFAADTVTADVTLYAKWEEGCIVTFKGGRDGMPDLRYAIPEREPIPAEKLKSAAAAFKTETEAVYSWYRDEACTQRWDPVSDTVTEGLTLYAEWGLNAATVITRADSGYYCEPRANGLEIRMTPDGKGELYEIGLGTIDFDSVTKDGDSYTFTIVERQYQFVTVTFSGGKVDHVRYFDGIRDGIYYPCWVITFHTRGGSLGFQSTVEYVFNGRSTPRPADPTREGYSFGNWYTQAEGGNRYTFSDPVYHDTDIYARWNCKVILNPNYEGAKNRTLTLPEGSTIPEEYAPERKGYAFYCWTTDARGTSVFKGTVTEAVTLFAVWIYPPTPWYLVSFDTSGHGSPVEQKSVVSGDYVPADAETSDSLYTFAGWYYDTAFKKPADTEDRVFSDITLYAKWLDPCSVKFYTLYGTAPDPLQVKLNGLVTEPAAPTETNLYFRGWYRNEDCTQKWDFAADTVPEDLTLYARWEKETIIGVDPHNGKGAGFFSGITGELVDPSSIPHYTNGDLVIEGYYTDSAYTDRFDFDTDVITENLSLHIRWANPAPITVESDGNGMVDGKEAPFRGNLPFDDDNLYFKGDGNTLILAQHGSWSSSWAWSVSHAAAPKDGYRFMKWTVSTDGSSWVDLIEGNTYKVDKDKLANGVAFKAVFEELPPHVHSFTYKAAGNALWAVCENDGCTLPTGEICVFLECDGKTYDGRACEADVTDDTHAWMETFETVPVPVYYLADGATLTTPANSGSSGEGKAPVFAGTYVAEAEHENTAAKKTFTINVSDKPILADTSEINTSLIGAASFDIQVFNVLDRTLSFTSGDPSVVTVDAKTGTVRPAGPGTAVITITAEASPNASESVLTKNITYTELKIAVPEENPEEFYYTGVLQEYLPVDFDEQYAGKVLLSGNTATESGTYTVTAETAAGYVFDVPAGTDNHKATYSWTIGKGVPVISIAPGASAAFEGDKLSESTLSGGKAVFQGRDVQIQGTFAFEDGTQVLSVEDSGKTEFKVIFTPEDPTRFISAECTVKLTVLPIELTMIEITTPPAKTVYTAGESFDSTGMTVTATYSDGSTKTVTDYTVTPDGALTAADTAVTVSLTGDGVTRTAEQAVTVNPVPYVIIDGADGEWTKGSTAGQPFRSNAPYEKFSGVQVDGKLIADTNYTSASGSTIVNLKPAYLETLAPGEHSLTVVSKDGSAYCKFYIKAAAPEGPFTVSFNMNGHGKQIASQTVSPGDKAVRPSAPTASGYTFNGWYTEASCRNKYNFNTAVTSDLTLYAKWTSDSGSGSGSGIPKTGDGSNMRLWTALALGSLAGLACTAVYGRKRKKG